MLSVALIGRFTVQNLSFTNILHGGFDWKDVLFRKGDVIFSNPRLVSRHEPSLDKDRM